MKAVMDRLDPFSMRKMLMLSTCLLPFTLVYHSQVYLSRKATMLFTNLNASKVPYNWAGKEGKNIFILA
jgi:hypothetical protein